jgi:hypothetical protein
MWIVDFLFLITAFLLFTKNGDDEEDEEGEDGEPHARRAFEKVPMSVKLLNLVTTCLFILLQIFILAKLDHSVDFSWAATFAPWIAYECVNALSLVPSAVATISPPPPGGVISQASEEGGSDEQEELLHALAQEGKYLEAVLDRTQKRHSLWNALLQIWLAVFLSLELDMKVDWNWGLTLLPIWIYIFTSLVVALVLRGWGSSLAEGLNPEDPPPTARDALKLQMSAGVHGMSTTLCFSQCVILLMALLLVFRLQMSNYSTFLIIFPVFVTLGCCFCVVFCLVMGSLMVDTDELMKEEGQFTGENPSTNGSRGGDAEQGGERGYVAPVAIIDETTMNVSSSPAHESNSPVQESLIVLEIPDTANVSSEGKSPTGAAAVTEDLNEID